jgi:hypothetical protein
MLPRTYIIFLIDTIPPLFLAHSRIEIKVRCHDKPEKKAHRRSITAFFGFTLEDPSVFPSVTNSVILLFPTLILNSFISRSLIILSIF